MNCQPVIFFFTANRLNYAVKKSVAKMLQQKHLEPTTVHWYYLLMGFTPQMQGLYPHLCM